MATEKLAEGIRKFAEDSLKLEKMISEMITEFIWIIFFLKHRCIIL